MPWLYLLLAGLCEMAWPLGFKYTNGFKTNGGAMALTFAIMALSFWFLAQATGKGIHVGTAYAIWTGIGAAGTAILGIMLFNEPKDLIRLFFLAMIVCGALGLKFLTPPAAPNSPTVDSPSSVPADSTKNAG